MRKTFLQGGQKELAWKPKESGWEAKKIGEGGGQQRLSKEQSKIVGGSKLFGWGGKKIGREVIKFVRGQNKCFLSGDLVR